VGPKGNEFHEIGAVGSGSIRIEVIAEILGMKRP